MHNFYCSDCEGSFTVTTIKVVHWQAVFHYGFHCTKFHKTKNHSMSLRADNLQQEISSKSVTKYGKYKHRFICTLLPLSGVMMTVKIKMHLK